MIGRADRNDVGPFFENQLSVIDVLNQFSSEVAVEFRGVERIDVADGDQPTVLGRGTGDVTSLVANASAAADADRRDPQVSVPWQGGRSSARSDQREAGRSTDGRPR